MIRTSATGNGYNTRVNMNESPGGLICHVGRIRNRSPWHRRNQGPLKVSYCLPPSVNVRASWQWAVWALTAEVLAMLGSVYPEE